MLLQKGPQAGLDLKSAPTHAVLLLKELFQAALEDRDLKMFAFFVRHCLEINDHQRWTAKELSEVCSSWGDSFQDA